MCKRCKTEEENLLHMFVFCTEVAKFWKIREKYILDESGIIIKFSSFMIIFGYHLADSNRIPINVLIIIARKYIYDSTLSNINLNMRVFKHRLQEIYLMIYIILNRIGEI